MGDEVERLDEGPGCLLVGIALGGLLADVDERSLRLDPLASFPEVPG
jgi:hypothetical protein